MRRLLAVNYLFNLVFLYSIVGIGLGLKTLYYTKL